MRKELTEEDKYKLKKTNLFRFSNEWYTVDIRGCSAIWFAWFLVTRHHFRSHITIWGGGYLHRSSAAEWRYLERSGSKVVDWESFDM